MEVFSCDLYQHNSLQIKCLKMCGIWFFIPYPKRSIRFWLHLLCKIVMGVLVFVLPVTGQGIYLIKLIMSGHVEIQEAAGIINLVLTELLISLKLLDMRYRRDLLTELEAQMERKEFLHYSGRQKRIIEKGIKLSRKLYVGLIVIATMDITVHIIIVPAIHNFKVLPVNMDFIFFDVLEDIYFKLIFIYQMIYKPILLLTFSSLQTMRWSYMLCAISQLDVLIYNFENMKPKTENVVKNDNAFGNALKRCVIHHCAIIELISSIERTFGGQFILFFIINSCIICTTTVQFVSFKNPLSHIMEILWMFVFVFLLVIILFIDCHFGSTITQRNSYISTVVYCFPWITLPHNMKKNLIIFISVNQRTLAINAAKLIPVSMATFTKVMNWTYKSFAVLNQMKK